MYEDVEIDDGPSGKFQAALGALCTTCIATCIVATSLLLVESLQKPGGREAAAPLLVSWFCARCCLCACYWH